ncbi:MAG TPA: ABC transporter ATP-binding protein [Kofleriaceae bacterium]|nr:ABC transporter ATP-binding protein [Kofleriaceae bacterium]
MTGTSTGAPTGTSAGAPTAAITARGVAKQVQGHAILRDLSLEIRRSELACLIGPSGCGKSTLLRLISGLERDHTGELDVAGQPITGPSRRVGFMFQEPRLLPWLTVRDNIALGLPPAAPRRAPADADARIDALLAQVQLSGTAGALPRQLSGGMAQRVALARALAAEPEVLLLDEPFSAVDAITRGRLQQLVLEIWHRTQITMLLVTHDLDEALVMSDRVLVLSDRPARVATIVEITAARPRDRRDPVLAAERARLAEALERAADPPEPS